jgi:predicted exporter
MKRVVRAVSGIVLLWLLTGCALDDDSVLQGTVKSVMPRAGGVGGTVLVSGFFDGQDVPGAGLVSLGVDANTSIIDQRMGETGATSVALTTLMKGQKIRAEISGPVMESYPMRATATRLIIVQ